MLEEQHFYLTHIVCSCACLVRLHACQHWYIKGVRSIMLQHKVSRTGSNSCTENFALRRSGKIWSKFSSRPIDFLTLPETLVCLFLDLAEVCITVKVEDKYKASMDTLCSGNSAVETTLECRATFANILLIWTKLPSSQDSPDESKKLAHSDTKGWNKYYGHTFFHHEIPMKL